MSSKPTSKDEWRTVIAATIERLSLLSSRQFFDETTQQYDPRCTALDWIGGAFQLDVVDLEQFMAASGYGRGPWLPLAPAALDAMSNTEIYYRLRENIAGENWVDGALVDAFESGVLAKALDRLLIGLNDFEIVRS